VVERPIETRDASEQRRDENDGNSPVEGAVFTAEHSDGDKLDHVLAPSAMSSVPTKTATRRRRKNGASAPTRDADVGSSSDSSVLSKKTSHESQAEMISKLAREVAATRAAERSAGSLPSSQTGRDHIDGATGAGQIEFLRQMLSDLGLSLDSGLLQDNAGSGSSQKGSSSFSNRDNLKEQRLVQTGCAANSVDAGGGTPTISAECPSGQSSISSSSWIFGLSEASPTSLISADLEDMLRTFARSDQDGRAELLNVARNYYDQLDVYFPNVGALVF
jgi:hypothetical protein